MLNINVNLYLVGLKSENEILEFLILKFFGSAYYEKDDELKISELVVNV